MTFAKTNRSLNAIRTKWQYDVVVVLLLLLAFLYVNINIFIA